MAVVAYNPFKRRPEEVLDEIGGTAPTGSAGGDLADTYPNPRVRRFQGRSVASTAPTNGQVYVWNSAAAQWEPGAATAGAHAANHISGGSDAFTSSQLLDAVVKRLQESGASTTLTVGVIADGQIVRRSGTTLAGVSGGTIVRYVALDESAAVVNTDPADVNWHTQAFSSASADAFALDLIITARATVVSGSVEFHLAHPDVSSGTGPTGADAQTLTIRPQQINTRITGRFTVGCDTSQQIDWGVTSTAFDIVEIWLLGYWETL